MNKKTLLSLSIILLAIISFFIFSFKLTLPNKMDNQVQNTQNNSTVENTDFESLTKEIIKKGSGDRTVKNGDTISVHYVGTLPNGEKFDSSYDRNEPFTFTVGAGRVIQGWEQGVLGMQVGETRKLKIPSNMAYGEQGYPPTIPPKTGLIFEITLLKIN